MKKTLIAASFLALFAFEVTQPAGAEDNPDAAAPTVQFAPLDGGFQSELQEALLNQKALPQEKIREGTPADIAQLEVWRGNLPRMRHRLTSVRLHFLGPAADADAGAAPTQPFTVDLSFDERGAVVRHSRSAREDQKGGMLLRFDRQKSAVVFLAGPEKSSMMVFAPPNAGADMRAAVFCPREFPETIVDAGGVELIETSTKLDRFEANFEGKASGGIISGIEPSRALVRVLSSSRVAPSKPYRDAAFALNPSVEIEYRPVAGFTSPSAADQRSLQEGIRLELNLETSGGHRRISETDNVVHVQEFEIDSPVKTRVGSKYLFDTVFAAHIPKEARRKNANVGMEATVEVGRCYLVYNQVLPIQHRYEYTTP